MSFEVPFLRVKSLSTPTYWGKTILSRLWLQTALSFLCPKRVTLSRLALSADAASDLSRKRQDRSRTIADFEDGLQVAHATLVLASTDLN